MVKGFPWIPERGAFEGNTSVGTMDFKLMQAAGVNNLRLGFMWPGAEPQRGVYNETYFEQFGQIVEEAKEYGIYTYADMHQD